MMERSVKLVDFLTQDLGVEAQGVAIAQRKATPIDPIHLVLWQLGLISIQQLERALVWLEGQPLR